MKDFGKNKQAFKQVCLLAIIVLNFFFKLFFHTSSLFSKGLRQFTMGKKKKKKKNTRRRGKAERKARGKYRMEPMIVNWSHQRSRLSGLCTAQGAMWKPHIVL